MATIRNAELALHRVILLLPDSSPQSQSPLFPHHPRTCRCIYSHFAAGPIVLIHCTRNMLHAAYVQLLVVV